jgi:hypothetical protein
LARDLAGARGCAVVCCLFWPEPTNMPTPRCSVADFAVLLETMGCAASSHAAVLEHVNAPRSGIGSCTTGACNLAPLPPRERGPSTSAVRYIPNSPSIGSCTDASQLSWTRVALGAKPDAAELAQLAFILNNHSQASITPKPSLRPTESGATPSTVYLARCALAGRRWCLVAAGCCRDPKVD